jgi:precorrin-3B C17-methyltransferase
VDALRGADVIIGYAGYIRGLDAWTTGKESIALPLGQELERAELAVAQARAGRTVCVISSGDAGIYGMASPVLEAVGDADGEELDVAIVPGISAVNAAAALLGAPLGHDFAVVSLSDLLTPWEQIEQRLRAAAAADFVIALLNPQSRRRDWQLARAREILRAYRSAEVPVGIVKNAYRDGQTVRHTTLADMLDTPADMFTTIIVGNCRTRQSRTWMVTPRGYAADPSPATEENPYLAVHNGKPETILAESFRIIDECVGIHGFSPPEWTVVRRIIHATGDLDFVKLVRFHHDAIRAGVQALRDGTPLVTDVRMVATGIRQADLQALDVALHCWIDDADVAREAAAAGTTRSACAMEKAIQEVGDAIYVIGNAPTALLKLSEAVRARRCRPRLVLAMPVGFVSVVESKAEACGLDVPVIVVQGRKGGSAVAAAAVNALLQLALAEESP